ncbi:MAG: tRNA pseudouridine(55) synthase TruB [Lachnospiraceae bacterium]|nr:tRNA pseudouridine(55) synthase TruB [Lachnospiraceae bacterium]
MFNGVINVYKEPGFTSFDVVAKLRGIAKQKKIGHTGTLDPDAVGVLPVCLGRATKLCELLTDETKEYKAVLLLGRVTDTQDTSGAVLEEHPVEVSEEELRRVVDSFRGEQMQIPPMYSALKVNGKKLYELAREGKTVERKPRPVTFYELEIGEIRFPEVELRVVCSKGTYIRTLCNDIGEKLGCGGCMAHLTRSRVGVFTLEETKTLAELQELADQGRLSEAVLPVDRIFDDLPQFCTTRESDAMAHNGNTLRTSNLEGAGERTWKQGEAIRVYDSEQTFVGIYERAKDGSRNCFRLKKMFYSPQEN